MICSFNYSLYVLGYTIDTTMTTVASIGGRDRLTQLPILNSEYFAQTDISLTVVVERLLSYF